MVPIKGQNTLVPAIFMMALLTVGFFGIVTSGDMVQRQVEYNSDHTNLIAEAKLKADAYEERMSRELLYTSNTEALRLGDEEGGLNWEYNVPKYQELKTKYLEDTGAEIRTQNDVLACSNPSIDDVSANSTRNWYNVTLSNHWITCTSEPLGEDDFQPTEATVNISPKFSITHNDNRYLEITNYSSTVTQNASWIIEEEHSDPFQEKGSASYCEGDSYIGQDEDTEDNAKREARLDLIYNLALEAYENTDQDRPDFIETDRGTDWPEVGNSQHFIPRNDGQFTNGDYEIDDGCEVCEEDEDGNEDCTDHDVQVYGYIYRPLWVDLNYHFEDSEERIINSDARLERLDFEFTHRHEVN